MIYLDLFLCFVKIGVFSIGGGYAAIPLIQSQAVEKMHWISLSEFTNLISIAEMTPGPITVNSATFIGTKIAGIPGALAATSGCILPSVIIVSVMFFIYEKFGKMKASQTVLSFIRPAVVALIASTGISILLSVLKSKSDIFLSLPFDPIILVLFLFALFALKKFKINPIIVMSICGAINLIADILIKEVLK